jgi:RNA-directed DNA polymerase
MHSFNVDDKLKDRTIIREALIKTCKAKKKKRVGPNRKYKQAQCILAHLNEYTEKTLGIVLAFEAKKLAEERGDTVSPEVLEKSFAPRKCVTFTTKDGPDKKTREINSVPLFPDQVIHQLVIIAAQPALMRGMYEYSCGSIPGRGIHKGKQYLEKYINHHLENNKAAIKYGAQLDAEKCYRSFAHSYLKGLLRKKFRGKLFLWIIFKIIDSYNYEIRDGEAYGLPIGFATSQWLCNFGMTPLDHFIKEVLGVEFYLRYMDDMIIFARNKKKLREAVKAIAVFLEPVGLRIKHTWQVFRFDYIDHQGRRRGRPFDTLGFRFFRDKLILRKRLALAIRRSVAKVGKTGKGVTAHAARSLMSRLGWLRHCDSYNFYNKYVKPFIDIKYLKEVIRSESREHNYAGCPVYA